MDSKYSVVITDFDNTLYDWVEMWYQSFRAMLTGICEISGLSEDVLKPEIRNIFQKHGTTEYSFVIQEIPSLLKLHPGQDLTQLYAEAIDAYREARDNALGLYPTVMDTLQQLKQIGCRIAVFTESTGFYSRQRIQKLGLDGIVDFLYSPTDHRVPKNIKRSEKRQYSDKYYRLAHTEHRYLREKKRKPAPQFLRRIIKEIKADRTQTLYVGDSLMKDIVMAQEAAVVDVYAKYGLAQNRSEYELLREVSHWTDADVAREKAIHDQIGSVQPTYVLENSFSELLEKFEFEAFKE